MDLQGGISEADALAQAKAESIGLSTNTTNGSVVFTDIGPNTETITNSKRKNYLIKENHKQ